MIDTAQGLFHEFENFTPEENQIHSGQKYASSIMGKPKTIAGKF